MFRSMQISQFIVLAAMDGEFVARKGNFYENFQMLGYVESINTLEAVRSFFDDPQFPIDWGDVKYMWAEPIDENEDSGHYGEYQRIFTEELLELRREKLQRKFED